MTTSVAKYYLDELQDWQSTIDVYLREIDSLEEWLKEFLRFNSVPDLAGKTEHFLGQLALCKQGLLHLEISIQLFETNLYKDHTPVENELINEEFKNRQKELRSNMHHVERDYLMVKYNCDEFLSNFVDIQNKKKGR